MRCQGPLRRFDERWNNAQTRACLKESTWLALWIPKLYANKDGEQQSSKNRPAFKGLCRQVDDGICWMLCKNVSENSKLAKFFFLSWAARESKFIGKRLQFNEPGGRRPNEDVFFIHRRPESAARRIVPRGKKRKKGISWPKMSFLITIVRPGRHREDGYFVYSNSIVASPASASFATKQRHSKFQRIG